MKSLIISLLSVLLFSCQSQPVENTAFQVNAGWDHGKPVLQTYYLVEVSVSQGIHYAFKAGYIWQLIIGLAFVVTAGYVAVRKAKSGDSPNLGFFGWLLVLLVSGFALVLGKPLNIAGHKYKVTKESYDYHKGDTGPLIDSIYSSNHLISAAR